MTVTSINLPAVGVSVHVSVVNLDFSPPGPLSPSGVVWVSSPNASGQVTVVADATGFIFTALTTGSWTFTATYNPGGAHANLAVTVGPIPNAIGFNVP